MGDISRIMLHNVDAILLAGHHSGSPMSDVAVASAALPYLQQPLVLVGFVLLLFFGLAKVVARSRVLTPITGAKSYRVLQSLLAYGFVLAVAVIALGFGLKYRELSQAEQQNAVGLLSRELEGNLATVESLRKNTITLMSMVGDVAKSLRQQDIVVLKTLFPNESLDGGNQPPAREMALNALSTLLEKKLDKNKVEMARADAVAKIIRATIDRTLPTVVSMADKLRERYQIREGAWAANLPILSKVFVSGVPKLQNSYVTAQKMRSDYGVVCSGVPSYLEALHSLLDKKVGVNLDTLTALLAQERQSITLLTSYGQPITEALVSLRAAQAAVNQGVSMGQ